MRFFMVLSAFALPVFAGITPSRPPSSDVQILNFILVIESLLNALFQQGLDRFTPADIVEAGYPPFTYGRLEQIERHSEIHMAFLSQAITDSGSAVVQPCTYALPLEDPHSLISAGGDLATVLASVSYGAIGQMENSDYRTTLGSMSGTTSRQAGWLYSAVLESNAWNTAFDAPLTVLQAWTYVQSYISSCPQENTLYFSDNVLEPFNSLVIEGTLIPGSRGRLNFDKIKECLASQPLYVAFLTGISELRTPLEQDGSFDVPQVVANLGIVYIFVIGGDSPVTDKTICAGPAMTNFASNSRSVSF